MKHTPLNWFYSPAMICMAFQLFFITRLSAIVITSSDPTTVQSGIIAAYQAGQSSVTITSGTYYLPSLSNSVWHLYFTNMTRAFTVNAQGAMFIFTDRTKRSLAFENCSNITWNGGTFIRGTIPFSQGTIQAVDPAGLYIDIAISAGYPTDITNLTYFTPVPVFNVFDGTTRQLKQNVPDIYVARSGTTSNPWIESLGANVFRFHCQTVISGSIPVCVGDLAAWRGTVLHEVDLRCCQNMTLDGLTIMGAAGMAVKEECGGGGNHYNNIVETYPPTPAGATQIPLLASNADGFNSAGVPIGPTLTNCFFEGLDDDGIAIHGAFGMITEPANGNVLIADCPSIFGTVPYCQVGDTIRFYNNVGAWAGEATLTSVTALSNYTPPQPIPSYFRYFQGNAKYYQLTVDQAIPAQSFWTISNTNRIGSGFSVTNCTVRNTRAHGMLIKAGNGLIQNCTLENTLSAGILVMPELESWGESDYARNLTISNNIISGVGIARQFFTGALTIANYAFGQFVPIPGGHRNITVEGNLFQNNNGVNILVSSADAVQLSNNLFINPMQAPVYHGAEVGIDQGGLIWLTQCTNVNLTGNALGNPGTQMTHMIEGTATASGSGFTTGVVQYPDIVANLNDGASSSIDAFPGLAGLGWKDTWKTLSTASTTTGTAVNASPLAPQGSYYLCGNVTTTSTVGSQGAIYRRFDGTSAGVNCASPHRFMFDLRIDNVASDMRYFVFDRINGPSSGTDGNDTWMIVGTRSGWAVFNGNRAGAGTFVNSTFTSITAGTVYHFTVDVDPATKSWAVSISDDIKTYSSPTLGFRVNSASDGEYLEFGATNNNTTNINTFGFSIDAISILGIP